VKKYKHKRSSTDEWTNTVKSFGGILFGHKKNEPLTHMTTQMSLGNVTLIHYMTPFTWNAHNGKLMMRGSRLTVAKSWREGSGNSQ
jgi:hypothetical protein